MTTHFPTAEGRRIMNGGEFVETNIDVWRPRLPLAFQNILKSEVLNVTLHLCV
jgi:hypothetical protein